MLAWAVEFCSPRALAMAVNRKAVKSKSSPVLVLVERQSVGLLTSRLLFFCLTVCSRRASEPPGALQVVQQQPLQLLELGQRDSAQS